MTLPVQVSVFGKTDLGRARDHNEDTFLVADLSTGNASLHPEVRRHQVGPRGSLFMVADGMGGAAAGELASAMAADLIYHHLATAWVADDDASAERFAFRMKEAVELANAEDLRLRARASRGARDGDDGDGRRRQRQRPLPGAGRRQPRLSGAERRGHPAHQGPVAHAAAGRRRRAHGGRGRAERAPQHHPPGAGARSSGEGRPHPTDPAPGRHPDHLLRRPLRAGQARGVRRHGGGACASCPTCAAR